MPPKATISLKRKRSKTEPDAAAADASNTSPSSSEEDTISDQEEQDEEEEVGSNNSSTSETSEEEVDEFDVEEQDRDSNSDEDNDDEEPRKKSQAEAFSAAFTSLVSSKVKAHSRNDPILVRGASRKVAKEIDQGKIEARAKRALASERKQILDRGHQRNILPQDPAQVSSALEYERKLRKVGQRGVVRLFNAVLASQARVASSSSSKNVGDNAPIYERQKQQINEMSKQGFLDYIKAKTAADAS